MARFKNSSICPHIWGHSKLLGLPANPWSNFTLFRESQLPMIWFGYWYYDNDWSTMKWLIGFQNKGWFKAQEQKEEISLFMAIFTILSIIQPEDNALGQSCFYRCLVVLFSHVDRKKKERVKKIAASDTQKSTYLHLITSLLFVPALFHTTVHTCVTETTLRECLPLVCLFFFLSPSLSLYLPSSSLRAAPVSNLS